MPNTTPTDQALDQAIHAVPAEQFHGVDGRAVRPCTPAAVTHRHLRMLDVHPGANVMDIGIGSGLSAALLAQLAGPEGRVTAVEIDPALARRAEALYAEYGHQVAVVVGDGLLGYPQNGPYDRILVGTTPPAIPDAWLQQLKPGGTLLSGVRIADLPGAYAIARITVDDKHQPHQVEIHHGGYTPMVAPAPADTASRAVDTQQPDCSLTPLSDQDPSTIERLLAALRDASHTEPTPAQHADYFHLKNWLIATEPAGLLEATIDHGTGIGLGSLSPNGTAHVAIATDEHLIADHIESSALEVLHALIHQWREAGSPRTHELPARLTRDTDVWQARVSRS
ncbi:protein-L-isoaspartate O-methyltransferase family protein [Streptomyces halobius]|uniref:Protein-L-isoaspartate O-methyltransferase n=1 Tax=Streptomyces halobius TaxID=2879846 RepID=A0ABY4M5L2_9ACTN|nr:methyltransferase domain-containing protein [Streptomyces halobius]UQA91526.1 protein-L-isoaspartate O-methyltransferase [Streptomyces halobius]